MNHLGSEPSPYLRQHADNPVDWYPWGPEALERAKREDKPLLLSVGYSACHWCHVMAHESFEDLTIAQVMNESFINVKVDREERPDLDQLYQGVVQLMGQGGGWPLTIFMTPALRPFYGGTYFPPAPRHGLPSFPALLSSVSRAWKEERAEVEEQARSFERGLVSHSASGLDSSPTGRCTVAELTDAGTRLRGHLDPTWGGFGTRGPKFPSPMNLAFLLRTWRRTGDPTLKAGVLLTLEKMAQGGLYEQLGGGFHRYSVDGRWQVPHFEKMLYDNALLLHLYAEAQQVAPNPLWREVVEGVMGWLQREMTAPGGGLFSAQDADSEGEEGRFFVWRPEQVEALLSSDDASLVKSHFGIEEGGNFEHGTTVLQALTPLSQADRPRLERAKQVLFEARSRRVAPGLDDKILAGWNGLAIRGVAFASRVFERPDWLAAARRCADFVLGHLRRADSTLFRCAQQGQARLEGVLEDYGDLALGLVTLAQATSAPVYLEAAEQLVDVASQLFWDDRRQAWLAARKGSGDLLVPVYALHDNACPSGASTLTDAQLGLAALTGRSRHLERATLYLERMKAESLENPLAFGHLLSVADTLLDGAAELRLVGGPELVGPMQKLIDSTYLPTVSVQRQPEGIPPLDFKRGVPPLEMPPGAYLCQHFACQPPATSVDALKELLAPLTCFELPATSQPQQGGQS